MLSASGRLLSGETPPLDAVSQAENRFSKVTETRLPAVVESVTCQVESDPTETMREHFLAQYALAPIVLDTTGTHPLILGNFHMGRSRCTKALSPNGLILVHDFGNGIALFRRRSEP
jgi:hypothetical protein